MKSRMIEESVIQAVLTDYESTRSINKTVEKLQGKFGKNITVPLVKRILITYGRYSDNLTRKAGALLEKGKSIREICEELGLSKSTVINSLPYHNGITPVDAAADKPVGSDSTAEAAGLMEDTADSNTENNIDGFNLVDKSKPDCVRTVQSEKNLWINEVAGESAVTLNGISLDSLWQIITSRQGEQFYTVKNLPFTYEVRGGELFTDRRDRSITKSTFEAAFKKLAANPGTITGPKKLNVYGGPYVWAVLKGIGVIGADGGNDTSK